MVPSHERLGRSSHVHAELLLARRPTDYLTCIRDGCLSGEINARRNPTPSEPKLDLKDDGANAPAHDVCRGEVFIVLIYRGMPEIKLVCFDLDKTLIKQNSWYELNLGLGMTPEEDQALLDGYTQGKFSYEE